MIPAFEILGMHPALFALLAAGTLGALFIGYRLVRWYTGGGETAPDLPGPGDDWSPANLARSRLSSHSLAAETNLADQVRGAAGTRVHGVPLNDAAAVGRPVDPKVIERIRAERAGQAGDAGEDGGWVDPN